ncbi:helix-turn-helix transcriptional regulator [Saccharothrix coeruleofusca]|uniref:HTH luxR-type domain-containing protein n=1 Tax=Saccharothrix coeruleofusca TaxID=33919 RepID=A0A918AX15_9PSEU|nr:LuxR C-terminal-related transcriptional regulator [Saccharothrix coeruleofusca]MBP2336796.1 DNA-binding CsgD family transcriptional regulator [Saccharothrix coeruleofusca]GGP82621.1 hypothetical protein GCM10010185_65820 [Saccharothrix coeruleofusca]
MTTAAIAPAHGGVVDVPARQTAGRHAAAYRSLFERLDAAAVVDLGLHVLEANQRFVRDLAGQRDPVGRNLLDFLHRGGHANLRRQFVRLIQGKRDRVVERVVGLGADDRLVPGTLTAVAVHDHGPMVSTLVVTLRWDESSDAAPGNERRRILTELDARILEGVAAGMPTVKLAVQLYLSKQGVEYHVGTMLKKFKVPNRASLVSRAYSAGVLSPGEWPPKVSPEFIK